MEDLRNLQQLLVDGFISAAEYEHRRQQIVDKLTHTTLASSPLGMPARQHHSSSSTTALFGLDHSPYDDYAGDEEDDDEDEDDEDAPPVAMSRKDGNAGRGPLGRLPPPRRAGRSYSSSSSSSFAPTSAQQSPLVRKLRTGDRRRDHVPAAATTTTTLGGLSSTTTLTSSVCADDSTVMELAHKYALSRKISQLHEDALPTVVKIVEQLSPNSLRRSGGDWTFDLETLDDRTLWKLNDFVNDASKQHSGEKDSFGLWNTEEEKPVAGVSLESDPEDVDDQDIELDEDGTVECDFVSQPLPVRPLAGELKAVKRPRYLAFGAGEKRKRKEDIKKKDKERRLYDRAAKRPPKGTEMERKAVNHEDGDASLPTTPGPTDLVRSSYLPEEAVDEMEKDSENDYKGQVNQKHTSDTQLRFGDSEDESEGTNDSSCESDESDADWEPTEEPKAFERTMQQVKTELPLSKGNSEENAHDRKPSPSVLLPSLLKPMVKKETEAQPTKPFKIQVCIYSLAKKSNGKKPYVCDACDKAFADRSNLIQHLRVHTKEKPYACTHKGCDKRFAHSASLKEHLNTHSGDKPHLCTHPGCGMSFAQASNLRRHQVVHTGEKPFVCTVPGCSKSFTQKINLSQHLKRVHRRLAPSSETDDISPPLRRAKKRRRAVSMVCCTSSTTSTSTEGSSSASR